MPHQHPTTRHDPAARPPAVEQAEPEPFDEAAWPEEELELPRRPRRRLLTPASLLLTGVLLLACGFIGGALVEKGQSSSGSGGAAAGSITARIAALRGGAAGSSAARGSTTSAGGAGGGFTRPTSGQVAYLAGSTLYVTNAEGNTVKVATSPATSVTKSVKTTVKAIHPGETVSITGPAASDGTVTAESIGIGSAGGGLAALFGGGRGERSSSATGGGGGGTPSLFGSG